MTWQVYVRERRRREGVTTTVRKDDVCASAERRLRDLTLFIIVSMCSVHSGYSSMREYRIFI